MRRQHTKGFNLPSTSFRPRLNTQGNRYEDFDYPENLTLNPRMTAIKRPMPQNTQVILITLLQADNVAKTSDEPIFIFRPLFLFYSFLFFFFFLFWDN